MARQSGIGGDGDFQCPYCPKQYSHTRTILKHLGQKHLGMYQPPTRFNLNIKGVPFPPGGAQQWAFARIKAYQAAEAALPPGVKAPIPSHQNQYWPAGAAAPVMMSSHAGGGRAVAAGASGPPNVGGGRKVKKGRAQDGESEDGENGEYGKDGEATGEDEGEYEGEYQGGEDTGPEMYYDDYEDNGEGGDNFGEGSSSNPIALGARSNNNAPNSPPSNQAQLQPASSSNSYPSNSYPSNPYASNTQTSTIPNNNNAPGPGPIQPPSAAPAPLPELPYPYNVLARFPDPHLAFGGAFPDALEVIGDRWDFSGNGTGYRGEWV